MLLGKNWVTCGGGVVVLLVVPILSGCALLSPEVDKADAAAIRTRPSRR